MVEDFNFNRETGLFEDNVAESALGEIVLTMSLKAKSYGLRSNSGDWFFNPTAGTRAHTIANMRDVDLNLLKAEVETSLNRMVKARRLSEVTVLVKRNSGVRNRIDVTVTAVQADGVQVEYSQFYEVV